MIERTASLNDCEEAFEVSFNAFYPDAASNELKAMWHDKWFKDPSFATDCILVHREDGEIVAGLRTIERTIYRLGQEFKMLGIGEIFVKPGHQGKGLTGKLVNGVIEISQQGEYDLLVGIARKSIDGFYLKYGLWGVGSYSELRVQGLTRCMSGSEMTLKQVELSDISQLNEFYTNSYAQSFGTMFRSPEHWEFLINSAKNSNRKFLSIQQENKLIAYIVCDSQSIIEICAHKECDYVELLSFVKNEIFEGDNNLILNVPPSHPILEEDLGLDISCRLRECYYGGHILKITNKSSVIEKFIDREQQWYKSNHINSYSYSRANLQISWNCSGLSIKGENKGGHSELASDELDLAADTGCNENPIPDYVPYDQTLLLCGIQSQYRSNSHPPLSSPYLPFFIPPIDEF